METTVDDKLAFIRALIRVVDNVRFMHEDEDGVQWRMQAEDPLKEARLLLGGFGEGKGLTRVVALCTELLDQRDLYEVGVDPKSDAPWAVLQADLDPGRWGVRGRRARVLKILRKLSSKLSRIEQPLGERDTIIDFCEQRGILASTLRGRLRRHNERCAEGERIEAEGVGQRHRRVYDRADLEKLLTREERVRGRE